MKREAAMKLRPYQEKSADIAQQYFAGNSDKPSIIVAPTAFVIWVFIRYI